MQHLAEAPTDVLAMAEIAPGERRQHLLAAREASVRLQQWVEALRGY